MEIEQKLPDLIFRISQIDKEIRTTTKDIPDPFRKLK